MPARMSGLPIAGVLLIAGGVSACVRGDEPDGAMPPPPKDTNRDDTASLPAVTLVRAFGRLEFRRPIQITHAGDDRLFVVEQRGRIRVFDNRPDIGTAGVFLDITAKVRRSHNEEGLLAVAFHPRYADNGFLYVYYSASGPRRGVLCRFTVSTQDPNRADPDSELSILEVEQPYGNHNGPEGVTAA